MSAKAKRSAKKYKSTETKFYHDIDGFIKVATISHEEIDKKLKEIVNNCTNGKCNKHE